MLNHITLMGRLVRDPELRRTGSGVAVASFRIAVDRDYSPKDGGERKADFIDCVAWRQTGEFISKYFAKGRMIVVDGRLEMRDWTDKEGNKRISAEVIVENAYFGDSRREGDSGASFGGREGGEKETDFIDCVAWRQTGEFVSKYFTKGRMIVVSGRLQIRNWNDKDGNKRRTAEVVADNVYFGDSKRDDQGGSSYSGNSYGNYGSAPAAPAYGGYSAPTAPASDFAMLDDDDAQLPF